MRSPSREDFCRLNPYGARETEFAASISIQPDTCTERSCSGEAGAPATGNSATRFQNAQNSGRPSTSWRLSQAARADASTIAAAVSRAAASASESPGNEVAASAR